MHSISLPSSAVHAFKEPVGDTADPNCANRAYAVYLLPAMDGYARPQKWIAQGGHIRSDPRSIALFSWLSWLSLDVPQGMVKCPGKITIPVNDLQYITPEKLRDYVERTFMPLAAADVVDTGTPMATLSTTFRRLQINPDLGTYTMLCLCLHGANAALMPAFSTVIAMRGGVFSITPKHRVALVRIQDSSEEAHIFNDGGIGMPSDAGRLIAPGGGKTSASKPTDATKNDDPLESSNPNTSNRNADEVRVLCFNDAGEELSGPGGTARDNPHV